MTLHIFADGTEDWYNPADDYPEVVDCPFCGGPAGPLGQLGRRRHFRCRDCGMDCSEVEVQHAIDADEEARQD